MTTYTSINRIVERILNLSFKDILAVIVSIVLNQVIPATFFRLSPRLLIG